MTGTNIDDEVYRLEVGKADREAFTLCLALGTLEAMRAGIWPLEAGIWTLGRPGFWEALTGIDDKVLAAFQSADELDALAKLAGPSAAEKALDRMIAVVKSRLSALPEKSWHALWSESSEEAQRIEQSRAESRKE